MRRKYAYGETEAPEDIDTLRNEGEDEEDPFHHYVETPDELKEPDMDESKLLDREQEDDGLDGDRFAEDVENYGPDGPVDDEGDEFNPVDESGFDDEPGQGSDDAVDEFLNYCVSSDSPPDQETLDDYAQAAGVDDEDYAEIADFLEEQGAGGDSDGGFDPGFDQGGDEFGDESLGGLPPMTQPPVDGVPPGGVADVLGGGPGEEDEDDQFRQARRGRPVSGRASARKEMRKGAGMSLAQRNRTAKRGRRVVADDNGYTDGPTYGENNQGEQEQAFISETPGGEAVAAPVPGDGTISNTENTLVARIKYHSALAQKDLARYEALQRRKANRHYAEEFETPNRVDPELSGTDVQSLRGSDFEDTGLDDVETQPNDRTSARAFAHFDSWLRSNTGRTARQHGNVSYIRRQAARWAAGQGVSPNILFPTLGNVLRQARKSEGKRANVRRYADESLDVAAPQDRIDVEAPVKDDTDAKAQSSQFDLGDFAHNAGDQLADPDLSTDSQIWAPGTSKESRRTGAAKAVRYAEAIIAAGLAPVGDKWKIIGQAETMREAVVTDRTRLLESVITANRRTASQKVAAEGSRGTGMRALPRGLSGAPRTASARVASNDPANDVTLFLK